MKIQDFFRFLVVSYIPKNFPTWLLISYYRYLGIIGSLLKKRQRIIKVKKFSYQNSEELWEVQCTDGKIYIPTPARLSRFIWGIDYALDRLAAQYNSTDQDIRESTYIVDGGANIGEYAWWAMKRGAIGAIVIEPDEKNLACARLNLREYQGKTRFLGVALSEKKGVTQFFFAQDSANSSMYRSEISKKNTKIKKVRTITLDYIYLTFLKESKFILKLDAEGHEPEVILGGSKFFQNAAMFSIDVSAERNKQTTKNEVAKLLESLEISCEIIPTQNSRIIIRKSL